MTDQKSPPPPAPSTTSPPSYRRFFLPGLLVLAILALGIGWFAGLKDMLTLENLAGAREQVAGWIVANAVLLFIAWVLLYATATATMFPVASFLTILGGIFGGSAFGVLWGTLYAGSATLIGATLGACITITR